MSTTKPKRPGEPVVLEADERRAQHALEEIMGVQWSLNVRADVDGPRIREILTRHFGEVRTDERIGCGSEERRVRS